MTAQVTDSISIDGKARGTSARPAASRLLLIMGVESCHWLEIAQHVVGERVNRTIHHMRAPVADAERVAIGAARATRPVPMLPLAPPTFSIIIG